MPLCHARSPTVSAPSPPPHASRGTAPAANPREIYAPDVTRLPWFIGVECVGPRARAHGARERENTGDMRERYPVCFLNARDKVAFDVIFVSDDSRSLPS